MAPPRPGQYRKPVKDWPAKVPLCASRPRPLLYQAVPALFTKHGPQVLEPTAITLLSQSYACSACLTHPSQGNVSKTVCALTLLGF